MVIASGATVTINQAFDCVNLTVDGALTNTTAYTTVVSGNLVVNSSGSFNAGLLTLTVNGQTTINGSFTDEQHRNRSFRGLLTLSGNWYVCNDCCSNLLDV